MALPPERITLMAFPNQSWGYCSGPFTLVVDAYCPKVSSLELVELDRPMFALERCVFKSCQFSLK